MALKEVPYHITIEIENKRCKGLEILKNLGIKQCRLIDIRGLTEGLTRHLIKFPSKHVEIIPKDTFSKISNLRESGEETLAWFDSKGCEVCKTILSHASFLVSGRHTMGYTVIYDFVAPNFNAYKNIIATLEADGLKPKILEIKKFNPKGKILTEKQERILWLALKTGFFEYPRKIDTLELSQKLGIAPSTFSETTRRGMRKLLEYHFET
jgi:predicted DNA binding protein